eukprot:4621496-Lingulodinium_polyedra.AAC.1
MFGPVFPIKWRVLARLPGPRPFPVVRSRAAGDEGLSVSSEEEVPRKSPQWVADGVSQPAAREFSIVRPVFSPGATMAAPRPSSIFCKGEGGKEEVEGVLHISSDGVAGPLLSLPPPVLFLAKGWAGQAAQTVGAFDPDQAHRQSAPVSDWGGSPRTAMLRSGCLQERRQWSRPGRGRPNRWRSQPDGFVVGVERVIGIVIEFAEPTIAEPPAKRARRSLQTLVWTTRTACGQRGIVARYDVEVGAPSLFAPPPPEMRGWRIAVLSRTAAALRGMELAWTVAGDGAGRGVYCLRFFGVSSLGGFPSVNASCRNESASVSYGSRPQAYVGVDSFYCVRRAGPGVSQVSLWSSLRGQVSGCSLWAGRGGRGGAGRPPQRERPE